MAKTANYKSLISKSADQVQKEQIDVTVDQARISLDQGLLSVQSQLLNESSGVKTAEGNVAAAELALNNSKGAVPFNVQNILDLRRAKLQADENLIEAKAKVANLQGAFDYLQALKTELFG
jgi:hypothetical protein